MVPPQLRLRFGNEIYLFAFIAASAFTYSPALVMWSGICAATAWSIATLSVVLLPDTVTSMPGHALAGSAVQRVTDPHRVFLNVWGRQVVVFLVTAGSLAALMRRARRLVERQTAAERERANLSRYFSPNLVDELAQADQPLGPTQQHVAVLFVDMVGFTRVAEALAPPAVIALLREFHGRMQAAVFAHDGTVDKYIGDAVMATFGTPRAGAHDASNALRAARAMCEAMTTWNRTRTARGEAPVAIGVGVHYGAVVLGDIGGESRLEFAVLGDTVNVASRLERATREIGATIVASDAVVAAARARGRRRRVGAGGIPAGPAADVARAGGRRWGSGSRKAATPPACVRVRRRAARPLRAVAPVAPRHLLAVLGVELLARRLVFLGGARRGRHRPEILLALPQPVAGVVRIVMPGKSMTPVPLGMVAAILHVDASPAQSRGRRCAIRRRCRSPRTAP